MKYIVEIADNISCDYLEDIIDERCIGQVYVSKYHETVDEEKLDELAENESYLAELEDYCKEYCYELGFKAGYHKAKKE